MLLYYIGAMLFVIVLGQYYCMIALGQYYCMIALGQCYLLLYWSNVTVLHWANITVLLHCIAIRRLGGATAAPLPPQRPNSPPTSISSMVCTMNMSCRSSMALSIQLLKGAALLAYSRCSSSMVSSCFSVFCGEENPTWGEEGAAQGQAWGREGAAPPPGPPCGCGSGSPARPTGRRSSGTAR